MREFASFLAVLGALFLIAAGSSWWRVGRDVAGAGRIRLAATSTGLAFWLLAAALLLALFLGWTA